MAALPIFNPFNPLCQVNNCLNYVTGELFNDASAQYSACVDVFGTPTVTTLTPPVETVFSTALSTVEYVDVIISPTTVATTAATTVVTFSTITQYTTIFTATETQTVTATRLPPFAARKNKKLKKKKKRGLCRHTQSSLTSLPPTSSTLSSEPSSVVPSTTASHCPSNEEYYSACSCINAVSTISTVIDPTSTVTSVIAETATVTVPSVYPSITTNVQHTTIYQQFLVTRTIPIYTTTTTTSTTTVTIHPTQTVRAILRGAAGAPTPPFNLDYVNFGTNGAISHSKTNTGYDVVIAADTWAQPYLATSPGFKLWVSSGVAQMGYLVMKQMSQVVGSDVPVYCRLDPALWGRFLCQTSEGHLTSGIYADQVYMNFAKGSYVPGGAYFKVDIVVASGLTVMT